jgi:hypothetical protein
MVGRTFSGFVVASTNTTCSGGSSSVFSSAFEAAALSICTSSTRYTFRFEVAPSPRWTLSVRSRMLSTLLFDAASSSNRSRNRSSAMAPQFSQTPHGSPSAPRFRQFSALARMRAVVVLPVPRGPENR